jgi:hypothetical protein
MNRSPFSKAMAVALQEYREAHEDVTKAIREGRAYGQSWELKQHRLARALDEWGKLPRKFYGAPLDHQQPKKTESD